MGKLPSECTLLATTLLGWDKSGDFFAGISVSQKRTQRDVRRYVYSKVSLTDTQVGRRDTL